MQDFEVARLGNAKIEFAAAFQRGYEQGKQELAAGKAVQMREIARVMRIEVPRNDVVDDHWLEHLDEFVEKGRMAALALCRIGEARFDDSYVDPDGYEARTQGKLTWLVHLTP